MRRPTPRLACPMRPSTDLVPSGKNVHPVALAEALLCCLHALLLQPGPPINGEHLHAPKCDSPQQTDRHRHCCKSLHFGIQAS